MATAPVRKAVNIRQMLPILGASTLGTAIEWYDFFLYGFLSATVFPVVFFPKLDPVAGIIASFTANFVGFAARPIGGAFFGWFGDRVGRKSTLIATLLLWVSQRFSWVSCLVTQRLVLGHLLSSLPYASYRVQVLEVNGAVLCSFL